MPTPLPRSFLPALALAFAAGCSCNDGPTDQIVDPPEPPTPAPQYDRGYYLDMAMDGQGKLWLAYQDREYTALTVGEGTGDPVTFTHRRIDGEARMENGLPVGDLDGGYYATIAVDESNTPWACHWDRDHGTLRCGSPVDGVWTFVVVDTGGVGQFGSLGIVNGVPMVAYYDQTNFRLKLAWKTDTGWSNEVVDEGEIGADATEAAITEPDVGMYADLFAEGGSVRIAYYDSANGNLKVASGHQGDWTVETWAGDGTGDQGQWPRLTSHGGVTYLAYEDHTKQDLLWGTWAGQTLTSEIVDGGDFVGPDTAIAWHGDSPAILYHDGVNNDAKMAIRNGTGWDLSTKMSDGAVGFHNQVVVDGEDRLHWVCFNHSTTDVVYQRFELP